MNFSIQPASSNQIPMALDLLKSAAQNLQLRKINQWSYWLNPPQEKIDWVNAGFQNKEFYFIYVDTQLAGMFRLLENDELYWGKQEEEARYIHSLVIKKEFTGMHIGKKVIEQVIKEMKQNQIFILRLDCDSSNQGLCSYYEKQGFVKVGEKQMPLSLNNLYELRTNRF
jgi:ribosomal protein S18 acetylase RimI-like enzyme